MYEFIYTSHFLIFCRFFHIGRSRTVHILNATQQVEMRYNELETFYYTQKQSEKQEKVVLRTSVGQT